ncbi:MAG: sensor histidine kinase [Chloroflexota bacterium]
MVQDNGSGDHLAPAAENRTEAPLPALVAALAERSYKVLRIRSEAELPADDELATVDLILVETLSSVAAVSAKLALMLDHVKRPLVAHYAVQLNTADVEELPSNVVFCYGPLAFALRQITQQLQQLQQMRQYMDELATLRASLQQQEHMTRQVEVLKNAIVRNVSHELKTPLLQVKSAVSLMSEDAEDSKLVAYAQNATGRLEALVKNITLLGSSLDVNLGPVIVRDAIEYARRNLRRAWEHRGEIERVSLDIDDNLPPVNADKQGLSTVIQLLLDNALKFSKQPVTVSARLAETGHVRIGVTDQGIGIAENHISSIFDTFYQVDNSSTRRYGGTGVGLALVKLILDNHNTEVTVNSVLGEGSTFSFILAAVKL